MKLLNTNTAQVTGLALESVDINFNINEVRFIVGANRRIAILNHELYMIREKCANHALYSIDMLPNILEEIQMLQNKLAMIMCPQLEEALITVSTSFLNDFEPNNEVITEPIGKINLKKHHRVEPCI